MGHIKTVKSLLLAGLFCSSASISAYAATEFNANTFFPATHPLAKHGYVEWAESLKASSNGELVAKVLQALSYFQLAPACLG